MIKTKLPSALVFGWNRLGEFQISSNLCENEGLVEDIQLWSYENDHNLYELIVKHDPDVIITFGDDNLFNISKESSEIIRSKWNHFDNLMEDGELANEIANLSTIWSCESTKLYGSKETPLFSIFTGTYKTGNRIFRAYDGLKNQTYSNWEWVVVDDSPEDDFDTWEKLKSIAETDPRVKIHRITPNSGGNIGEVKHRAASLSNGDWLLELDHDDTLASNCLEVVVRGIKQYPDAGFVFTGVAEIYENGTHKYYGPIDPQAYGREHNGYVFGYAHHEWVEIDGKKYVGGYSANINPKTIRYNMGMPNHARIWHRDVYHAVRGHNRTISVADDFELIVKTFLETKMLKIDEVLYMQWNNFSSTVDFNLIDINRRARLIRNYYDKDIHNRIIELGKYDWDWDEETQKCHHSWWMDRTRFFEREQVLNYIYTEQ